MRSENWGTLKCHYSRVPHPMIPEGYPQLALGICDIDATDCVELVAGMTPTVTGSATYGLSSSTMWFGVRDIYSAESLARVGHSAFRFNILLNDLTFENVDSIGRGAFSDCYLISELRSIPGISTRATINLPKCKTIASYAFYSANIFSIFSIPEVESIYHGAFGYIDSYYMSSHGTFAPGDITAIYLSTTPPTVYKSDGTSCSNAAEVMWAIGILSTFGPILYIPSSAWDTYANNETWCSYMDVGLFSSY